MCVCGTAARNDGCSKTDGFLFHAQRTVLARPHLAWRRTSSHGGRTRRNTGTRLLTGTHHKRWLNKAQLLPEQ